MTLLALILILSANPFQRTVSWDERPAAEAVTEYRVYWATGPGLKCSTGNTALFESYVGVSPQWHVGQSFSTGPESCTGGRCEMTFSDPSPGAGVIYFVVTALNVAGESALPQPVVP